MDNLPPTANMHQVQPYQQSQHSQKLIACLLRMENEAQKSEAKMELVQLSRDLMTAGKPLFLEVIRHPKISDMVKEHGSNTLLKVIFLMVKDFCSSINVVRNMNEDKMIESASMLLDECDNFRLELAQISTNFSSTVPCLKQHAQFSFRITIHDKALLSVTLFFLVNGLYTHKDCLLGVQYNVCAAQLFDHAFKGKEYTACWGLIWVANLLLGQP